MKPLSTVWGPHYWFFLFTIAYYYPKNPNEITKRKYYDLIQNMPLFIPDEEMGNRFAHMLDLYPVSPYLVNRDSFLRWVIFVHNKVNIGLGKPELSFDTAIDHYLANYKPKEVIISERFRISRKYIHIALILILLVLIYFFY
jgi:hypothetical protein